MIKLLIELYRIEIRKKRNEGGNNTLLIELYRIEISRTRAKEHSHYYF